MLRKKTMVENKKYLDAKFFTGEHARIAEGLRNRGLTADDILNIETLSDSGAVFVRVWYRVG